MQTSYLLPAACTMFKTIFANTLALPVADEESSTSTRRLSEALAGAAEEPCDSGDKFDIKVAACEAWCDAEYAADHCVMCKCQSCTFCASFDLDEIRVEREAAAAKEEAANEEMWAISQAAAEKAFAEEQKWREEEEAREEAERMAAEAVEAENRAARAKLLREAAAEDEVEHQCDDYFDRGASPHFACPTPCASG